MASNGKLLCGNFNHEQLKETRIRWSCGLLAITRLIKYKKNNRQKCKCIDYEWINKNESIYMCSTRVAILYGVDQSSTHHGHHININK